MKANLLIATLIASGLALASAARAEDAMSKPMAKTDKMDKMEKTDAMSKDKMKKTDGMMDKKDNMAKDGMVKDGMAKDGMKH